MLRGFKLNSDSMRTIDFAGYNDPSIQLCVQEFPGAEHFRVTLMSHGPARLAGTGSTVLHTCRLRASARGARGLPAAIPDSCG